MPVINSGVFRHLKIHGIEAGAGGEGFGREGTDQGPDFGGLDPGSAAAGAGGQGIGGAGIGAGGGGDAELGETFAAPESVTRQDLAAFSEFSAARDTFAEKLGVFLGFGPEATASVKRGAELSDPAAASAGTKTGVAFETAQALAGAFGLPTSVAVGLVDRIAAAAASPAFAAGRASINNPFSRAAPAAGVAAGILGQSASLAKAVEIGVNIAGVASQVPEGLIPEGVRAQPPAEEGRSASSRQVAQTPARQPELGARIESTTTQDFERQRRTLATREQLGRGALTVRRA